MTPFLHDLDAPWCDPCIALAPEFSKVAKNLQQKGSTIKLAKVNVAEEQMIATQLNITAIPHMRLYRRGKSSLQYNGEHKAQEITEWLLRKTGSSVREVEDKDTVSDIMVANKIVIIGFFDDLQSPEALMFHEAADAFDDLVFLITKNKDVYEQYGADDKDIFLFQGYGEDKLYYNGEFDVESIREFIEIKSTPTLVLDLNDHTAEKIFNGVVKSFIFFFFSREAGHYHDYLSRLMKVAKDFIDEVHFVTVNVDKGRSMDVLHLFGVRVTDIPTMRYLYMEDFDRFEKYRPQSNEMTESNIRTFVNGVLDNEIDPYMNQKEPHMELNHNSTIIELVTSTIDSFALDKTKDTVVLFYWPWCKVTRAFELVYEKIGELYKDSDTVRITKINVEENEAVRHHVVKEPVLKLFRRDDNKAVTYHGKFKYDDVVKFIELGGHEDKDEL